MNLIPAEAAERRTPQLTPEAARDLTDQIRTGMESIYHLIRSAYTGRAWAVLGYSSWDAYVTREFGNLHLRPPLEERQAVVLSMREVGMSTRAIATATQVSEATVRRDLAYTPAGASNDAPVTGVDGKTYAARRPEPVPAQDTSTRPLNGKSSLDDVLDMPAADFGIEPLDLSRRENEKRDRARRALTAFNGSGSAAVAVLIKAATPVASLVSPMTGESVVSEEDMHGVVWDSARCVRTLAHLIRTVGQVKGASSAEITSTLRDAVDDLDEVLTKLEETR